ncbi:MAG TPA: 16S rRNA (uracil(1498)-N(3))-methyltransferase [Nevskiaceae bacterium]|nr:16S rRNA (uracil(1498)-N(3))-methyltransferase [Nevskiaceae bacterium]
MTRLYVEAPLAEGARLDLPADAAHHAVQVLRLGAGATLTLFDGRGGEYQARIESADRRSVVVGVGAHSEVERESALDLTLAQCVSKGDRMDYTIQKAVELGVTRIVPLLSARSVVRLDAERWRKKLEHWRGVVRAACEQCGRNLLPELAPVVPLMDWLSHSAGVRLVLVPDAEQALGGIEPAGAATLLVGPEGGLESSEIEAAQRRGCTAVRLGPRVLRTETAGVALLAALQVLWGDLR